MQIAILKLLPFIENVLAIVLMVIFLLFSTLREFLSIKQFDRISMLDGVLTGMPGFRSFVKTNVDLPIGNFGRSDFTLAIKNFW